MHQIKQLIVVLDKLEKRLYMEQNLANQHSMQLKKWFKNHIVWFLIGTTWFVYRYERLRYLYILAIKKNLKRIFSIL